MNNITQEIIEAALTRALIIQDTSEEFIEVASAINDFVRNKLEDERGIDIDSNRRIPLDDIPYGEEVIRVENELHNVNSAISHLEQIADGEIPATAEFTEKFQEIIEDLDSAEGTLGDVCAEEIIKASEKSDEDKGFYL